MKKTAYYYLFLAAILAGGWASCQDEDQGFDYETVRASVYERDFLKEFDAPAPDHQWGFDAASYFMGFSSPLTRAAEDHMKKQNMTINNVQVKVLYGKPENIRENEHNEVAAWFHNHRVTWTNTPVVFDETNSTRQSDGKARVIDETYPGYGSLTRHTNPLGDYEMNENIIFHNGWVQHVSSIKTPITVQYSATNGEPIYKLNSGNVYFVKVGNQSYKKLDDYGNVIDSDTYSYSDSEISLYQGSIATGSHMDFLNFLGLSPDGYVWTEHMLDFNSAGGYGWGNQSDENATLVLDTDFNTWSYKGSLGTATNAAGHQFYDKYYVVYLEGDGYAGYYLGFDFESVPSGVNENDKRVAADGICDDWIIKIGDAGTTQYTNARILCEDLGTNDFDFNDVVIDIDVESNSTSQKGTVIVTVRAVGGTIPVCLCYGEHPSSTIENAALKKNNQHELHAIMGASSYTKPVNVNAPNGENKSAVSWRLRFGDSSGNPDVAFPNERFDLQKINIYVQHSDRAEWLLVRNYDAPGAVNAPQKICVPQTVAWPDECVPIKSVYPRFKDWIVNPTIKFWESSSSSSNNTVTVAPTSPIYKLNQAESNALSANGKGIKVYYSNASSGASVSLKSNWSQPYQETSISTREGNITFSTPDELSPWGELINCLEITGSLVIDRIEIIN